MQNTISLALYTKNATMLKDAYDRAMSVMTVCLAHTRKVMLTM